MLIVCPSCATSYMIDATSLGAGGRMVRCARCKATWFAGAGQEQVTAFVDEVIAEAEAESAEPEAPAPQPFLRAPAGAPTPPPTVEFGPGPNIEVQAERQIEIEERTPNFAFETSPEPAPELEPAGAHRESFEPQAIPDGPSLVPPMEHGSADEDDHEHNRDREDVESFAARRQRLKSRRKNATRTSHWTAAILVLLAFNVALIFGRSEVVSYFPQTASLFAAIGLPVNLRQLKFENVSIKPNGTGAEGLTVTGTIVSTASTTVKVPILRFAARNAAGQEIYTWTMVPERQTLSPGGKLNFRSDLASPPPDAKDVLVRFLTTQEAADMAAGAMKQGSMDRMKPASMDGSPQAHQ